ncbi:MAG: hypothetical protein Q4A66_10005, partial [Eubacteriales bacterium]|nr:hypothetical protein [Eubacteriales bacterium]
IVLNNEQTEKVFRRKSWLSGPAMARGTDNVNRWEAGRARLVLLPYTRPQALSAPMVACFMPKTAWQRKTEVSKIEPFQNP